jgi:hypothetical protein
VLRSGESGDEYFSFRINGVVRSGTEGSAFGDQIGVNDVSLGVGIVNLEAVLARGFEDPDGFSFGGGWV